MTRAAKISHLDARRTPGQCPTKRIELRSAITILSADPSGRQTDEQAVNMGMNHRPERWNMLKNNIGRLVFACLSFAIAGKNDAAIGVIQTLVPYSAI